MEAQVTATVQARGEQTEARNRLGRWNFLTFGGDIAFFNVGLSVASVYTIAPLFASHLGADNTVVALIPAIRALGFYAPQLLIAAYTERRRRVKPLLLALTIGERVPSLIVALSAFWLALARPSVMLAVLLLMTLAPAISSGLTFPPWYDLITRAMPARWLGRFLGFWGALGGGLGALGAIAGAAMIAAFPFPTNFALCFLMAFAAYIISFVLLTLGREPERASVQAPAATGPSQWSRWLRSLVGQARLYAALLRDDPPFRRLLIVNALAGSATMGGALFAVAASRLGGLTDAQVGVEGVVLTGAMTLGSLVWGFVGDHFGHRTSLIWGSVCGAGAGVLAMTAHGVWQYGAAFLLLGLSISAAQLAQMTATTQFAPESRRPTYIALASVAYAPFAVGAPLLGGWLADHWSYGVVFGLSAALAGIAAITYQFWAKDPHPIGAAA
ncbi:MAG TPA: MFS transporter [Ktedonobacterales bacterium]